MPKKRCGGAASNVLTLCKLQCSSITVYNSCGQDFEPSNGSSALCHSFRSLEREQRVEGGPYDRIVVM